MSILVNEYSFAAAEESAGAEFSSPSDISISVVYGGGGVDGVDDGKEEYVGDDMDISEEPSLSSGSVT